MREIKYRQPVYNHRGEFIEFHYWGFLTDGNFHGPMMKNNNLFDITSKQSTGLKDKNGKEIYEGDIIEGGFNGGGDYIKWCDKVASFHIFNKSLTKEGMDDYDYCCGGEFDMYEFTEQLNKIEIIGNIYENPNLLNND